MPLSDTNGLNIGSGFASSSFDSDGLSSSVCLEVPGFGDADLDTTGSGEAIRELVACVGDAAREIDAGTGDATLKPVCCVGDATRDIVPGIGDDVTSLGEVARDGCGTGVGICEDNTSDDRLDSVGSSGIGVRDRNSELVSGTEDDVDCCSVSSFALSSWP